MDVYQYLATNNPFVAREIIERFGYRCERGSDMSQNLRDLVNSEGEPALELIFKNHPDRDAIVEYAAPKKKKKASCGCSKTNETMFLNAAGQQNTQSEAAKYGVMMNTALIITAMTITAGLIINSRK